MFVNELQGDAMKRLSTLKCSILSLAWVRYIGFCIYLFEALPYGNVSTLSVETAVTHVNDVAAISSSRVSICLYLAAVGEEKVRLQAV